VPSVEPIDNRRRCRAEDPIPDLSRLTINLPMQRSVPRGVLPAVCRDDHPIQGNLFHVSTILTCRAWLASISSRS
jgi:hypothetical protein